MARVQTVRNPAGERAVSNEEGETFGATASKQRREKWQVRGCQGHDEATQRGFERGRKNTILETEARAGPVCVDK